MKKTKNKKGVNKLKDLAYEIFKKEFIADKSIKVENENYLPEYYIPTQETAKYLLIRLILEPKPVFTF